MLTALLQGGVGDVAAVVTRYVDIERAGRPARADPSADGGTRAEPRGPRPRVPQPWVLVEHLKEQGLLAA